MVYNPLNEPIRRKLKVNLYYTGLKDKVMVSEQEGTARCLPLDGNGQAEFDVVIPAKSQTWFTLTEE